MSCGIQRFLLSSSSTIIAKPRHITTVLYLRPSLAWTKRFFSVARNSDEAKSKPDELEKIADLSDGAFYVVRKGDAIGVYKNFADCQHQVCKSSTVSTEFFHRFSLDFECVLIQSYNLGAVLVHCMMDELKSPRFFFINFLFFSLGSIRFLIILSVCTRVFPYRRKQRSIFLREG